MCDMCGERFDLGYRVDRSAWLGALHVEPDFESALVKPLHLEGARMATYSVAGRPIGRCCLSRGSLFFPG